MLLCYLLALNPTDSVTEGFLPAAGRLGLDVVVLTDQPEAHQAASGTVANVEVLGCDVRDYHAVISRIATHRRPDAVFSNSDHLQTQTALAADYFGLPAKDWRAALRTKDKAEMRRSLAAAGLDATVWSVELPAAREPSDVLADLAVKDPYPCVVKPRQGVASEDVVWADGPRVLAERCREIRERRPHDALVAEQFLPGQLYTLETLGDGVLRHVLGGFRTELSALPYFIEESLTFVSAHPEPITAQVLEQLDALGVGFGACHTEFVVHEGRARLIEVNYRAIGDQCDLLLAELLGIPLFEHVLRVHLGEKLPPRLEMRSQWAARLDYPCASRSGTLVAAPESAEVEIGQVHLTYRPLRAVGQRQPLRNNNRDLLGVVRAVGPDQEAVDSAVAGFVAAHRWEIAA